MRQAPRLHDVPNQGKIPIVGRSNDRITIPAPAGPRWSDAENETSQVRTVVCLHGVPWLMATYDALRGMPLDSRAGFVVSLIDGRSTVAMILDMAAMPENETLGILADLLRLGAIEVR